MPRREPSVSLTFNLDYNPVEAHVIKFAC